MSAIDPQPVRTPSRAKWLAALMVAAVFFTGVFVGVIGDHIFLILHRQFLPPQSWMAHITPRIVKRLESALFDLQHDVRIGRLAEARVPVDDGRAARVPPA